MRIPFTKAHGAGNDFLLTWDRDVPPLDAAPDRAALARAICDRHTGAGADGWMLVTPGDAAAMEEGVHGAIQLYNSDGSMAEISGNGTRCAAALLIVHGCARDAVRIRTGAGVKSLRVLGRSGSADAPAFEFEMDMGTPEITAGRFQLALSTGPRDVTLIWVGNPQCAVPVTDFDFDWRAMGAEIERHPHFPNRTNVSFVRPVDEHTVEVRFFERGAGETMSSGTGSTGAAAMAVARGMAKSPLRVLTPAGPIALRVEGSTFLRGPAALVAEGVMLL